MSRKKTNNCRFSAIMVIKVCSVITFFSKVFVVQCSPDRNSLIEIKTEKIETIASKKLESVHHFDSCKSAFFDYFCVSVFFP